MGHRSYQISLNSVGMLRCRILTDICHTACSTANVAPTNLPGALSNTHQSSFRAEEAGVDFVQGFAADVAVSVAVHPGEHVTAHAKLSKCVQYSLQRPYCEPAKGDKRYIYSTNQTNDNTCAMCNCTAPGRTVSGRHLLVACCVARQATASAAIGKNTATLHSSRHSHVVSLCATKRSTIGNKGLSPW